MKYKKCFRTLTGVVGDLKVDICGNLSTLKSLGFALDFFVISKLGDEAKNKIVTSEKNNKMPTS